MNSTSSPNSTDSPARDPPWNRILRLMESPQWRPTARSDPIPFPSILAQSPPSRDPGGEGGVEFLDSWYARGYTLRGAAVPEPADPGSTTSCGGTPSVNAKGH